MLVQVSKATGPTLHWMVLKAHRYDFKDSNLKCLDMFSFSTDWASGGPIIERERIRLDIDLETGTWFADNAERVEPWKATGPTPLIAAMRCYVATKLGDEVEVPDALA